MANISSQIIASLGAILLGIVSRKLLQIGSRPADLPPGPPTIPILGNLHLMPDHDVNLQFQKWAQQYGPVYSLMLGTKTMIILSNNRAIKKILDKKSAISNDRMEIYIGQKIASGGLRVLMMGYGQTWRMVRRIMYDYDAAVNPDVSQRDQFALGAGRRICPGIHVADRSLYLSISRLLWAFDFKRPLDSNGKDVVPDPTQVTQGFLASPPPFKAVITPRDADRAKIIRHHWETAKRNDLDPETLQWKVRQ
ncbi:hypothetical protein JX266_000314 [Neoarthrinium moseri]|nr:hypothetical protein JX266_000314 [Neoarthrinium moseri]